ncbi:hypothetical protein EV11_1697 [Prochlorococcus sp. SS52]|uniref:Uncharacterized protein n=1 Tax=Prochlorococcus marinus (strain SARG / CCMP1375 / SS120) TaxID=167539 RepID=Q7VCK1_PROMA|nr:Predicted protein [Prochlorococcus marinus subsp. marinus str. CCMP1375]KGG11873.1 hypothetical protein EV04_0898 [Prochlorococcus marinus str. LG]KGG21820.1 hypothetical protein EV08_0425 [Prochlorococcus marinus str. SS2]KGG23749.1 hypothetical protein EV09_1374 [Prochlorococcus marinus str. SS35]KGG32015.1 hypothetical protein EV10_1129 [Prochlorococcus marinus str. SS51]KGG35294.1 hypothetical protein EV11_1697 [Prochlorococcus sp. SS52]
MQKNLEDRTVILIILCTLLLVFTLIFTFIPSDNQLSPSIQWKDTPNQNYIDLET